MAVRHDDHMQTYMMHLSLFLSSFCSESKCFLNPWPLDHSWFSAHYQGHGCAHSEVAVPQRQQFPLTSMNIPIADHIVDRYAWLLGFFSQVQNFSCMPVIQAAVIGDCFSDPPVLPFQTFTSLDPLTLA